MDCRKKKGTSYAGEGLVPSEDYKYGAILFIPKVSVVTGEYQGELFDLPLSLRQ